MLGDAEARTQISLARRMSWASRRETTRTGDIAYCLLGIFDVNMPLLYGEGPKAFIRLQEEIIRRSTDLSNFWHFTEAQNSRFDGEIAKSENRSNTLSSVAKLDRIMSCRGIFAHSPKDFRHCGKVQKDDRWRPSYDQSIQEFTLTNIGVYFKNPKLLVPTERYEEDNANDFYALDLNHSGAGYKRLAKCMMALRKVAPGIFARLDLAVDALDENNSLRSRMEIHETVHVVNAIPAFIDSEMTSTRECLILLELLERISFVGICSPIVVEEAVPSKLWDAASQRFFQVGRSFEGYLRPNFGKCSFRQATLYDSIVRCDLAFGTVSNRGGAEIRGWVKIANDAEADTTAGEVEFEQKSLTTGCHYPEKWRQQSEDELIICGYAIIARMDLIPHQRRSFKLYIECLPSHWVSDEKGVCPHETDDPQFVSTLRTQTCQKAYDWDRHNRSVN